METVSTYEDVIKSFYSTFQDKTVIPESLAMEWFLKAVGKFSYEIDPLNFNKETLTFNEELDRYVIDTLGSMMKKFYQQRELSKVNKRISIIGKDLSINSGMSSSKFSENELKQVENEVNEMLFKQIPTAYN